MTPEESRELTEIRPKWSNSEIRPFKDVESFLNISGVLQGETAQKSLEARKRFLDLLMLPDFHVMNGQEKAEAVGVSESTLTKWMIQCPDEYLANALKVMREKSAKQSLAVDAALYREATRDEGDAKHKELFYRRIEGWVPKQDMELSRGRDKELDAAANFDLLKELVKGLSPAQKLELLGKTPMTEGVMLADEVLDAAQGNVERLEGPVDGGK